jgi:lactose/L-arabinose transport system ATP-binding protein
MSDLTLETVRKSYGSLEVIKGVDLDIKSGEFVVFVGPSGCGKSTLLRMIAGLEDITSGTLKIGGETMNDVDPSKRGIAMVFQSYALYPHMTVRENMGFALRFAGVPKAEIARQVEEAARILELEPLLDRKPKQLSGGQRQRVAIGRAIVRHPRVFLFDEPLSNLDAELRVHMRIEIAKLHKTLATTVIYVTHDQVEAMTLADKIVVLRAGVVEQVGSPLDLYDDPENLFVAGFIGSPKMNFFPGAVEDISDGRLTVRLNDVPDTVLTLPPPQAPLKAGDTLTVGIRPEHFNDSGEGRLDLTIDMLEHLGGETFAYARHGSGDLVIVETKNGRALKSGEKLEARFDPARALFFGPDGKRMR